MGISAGVIGMPNIGKSTIFNALCSGNASAENYPFCTIDPNSGIVAIPDERHNRITSIITTEKVVPAFLELVDIAGLVKGASQGEGLGNQFLGHIKNVNAIVHAVRCFDHDDIAHVDGSINPVRDVETINTELILKDLETVERGIERIEKVAKSGDREAKIKVELFKKAHNELSRGNRIKTIFTDHHDLDGLYELHLLTARDVLYVANIDEDAITKDNAYTTALEKLAESEDAQYMKICAKIEAEIAELPPEDQKEFLESVGLSRPGLHILAHKIYRLLGLHTFFTATPKESRAWNIKIGTHAVEAAGTIHTDFAKGFVKAEVYTLKDLEEHRSESALRAAGKIRQEGRDYLVHDGDIIFFKFNV